jgi:mannitol/fructose-specific phosphotransferase system IIA component (Ntr-type)
MILLAIRDANGASAHMKVLARLARRVMDEGFRAQLEQETDPAKLCGILQQCFES